MKSKFQNKFSSLSIFERKVLNQVRKIPKGHITTYKILASKAGLPKGVRAVGNALKKNPELIKIPCHRVIRSDGHIGGYKLGLKNKIKLLKKEGIVINLKK